ncbi:MAG: hypothetical protein JSR24_22470 [Proteobacteria bacterium]|nr:hypothetical protein [Pseudomonadota bacterium]
MNHRLLAFSIGCLSVALVLSGCGSSSQDGGVETPAAARAAIEALPYRIDLRQPQGELDAIVGAIHADGKTSRFFVFVHGGEPFKHRAMVRALGGRHKLPLEEAELTDNYAFYAPPAVYDKLLDIEFEVEEALCEEATGETCGI